MVLVTAGWLTWRTSAAFPTLRWRADLEEGLQMPELYAFLDHGKEV